MPQSERRLYEPSEDVRFFDGAHDDFEEEGSRLPLLIIIALVVLASFAGVVWLAYTQGVQRGREDAPRILAEQSGRGFATNPYSQLQIYKQHKPAENGTRTGTASAPPTAAKPRPQPAASSPESSSAMATSENIAPVPHPKPIAAPRKPATAPPRSAPIEAASQSQGTPPPATAASSAPRVIAPALPSSTNLAEPRMETKTVASPSAKQSPASGHPQPFTPAAEAPAASLPADAAIQGAGYVLQIGSYTSAAEASASWQTYKGAHSSVAGYTPDVQQADLGKKGTWYRLRVGPFATMAEASTACAKLKSQGGVCFPTKR